MSLLPFSGPGPQNSLLDVPGVGVGSAVDPVARTGTTVILPDRRVVASVDVRGGAPGTRETDLLTPSCMVEAIDGIVLSGGSAFGLTAASRIAELLAAEGRGFAIGPTRIPILPAAILFDMANGGDKDWGTAPPFTRLGEEALRAVGDPILCGKHGAGYGAKAGGLEGGLGTASYIAGDLVVAALVAANPVGEAVMPGSDRLFAALFEQTGEMGGQPAGPSNLPPPEPPPVPATPQAAADPGLAGNTTIGVVATNAALTKAECRRLAIQAQDGIALAVRPAHTPHDGDTIFALSTGDAALEGSRSHALGHLGAVAAECVARAIGRAVYSATSIGNKPTYRERHLSA